MSINESKSDIENKVVEQTTAYYAPSVSNGDVTTTWKDNIAHIKHTFCSKEGWIGDYVCLFLLRRKGSKC
jgi:hypothetical protein